MSPSHAPTAAPDRLALACLLAAVIAAGACPSARAQTQAQAAEPPRAALPQTAAEDGDTIGRRDREDRLRQRIVTGKLQGWLSRAEARAAFRTLRALRDREAEMRGATGQLSRVDREELDRRLDDLAQSLRWAQQRAAHGGRRNR